MEKVTQMVRNYCGSTIRKTAEEFNINREGVTLILTKDLNMKEACSRIVPKNLYCMII